MIRRLFNWFYLHFWTSRLLKRLNNKMARRIYFVREYEATYRNIWKGEFKLLHFREIREDIRREWDKVNEDLDALNKKLEKEKEDSNIKDSLTRVIEAKKKDAGNFKDQIDQMDKEIKLTEETIDSVRVVLPLVEQLIRE